MMHLQKTHMETADVAYLLKSKYPPPQKKITHACRLSLSLSLIAKSFKPLIFFFTLNSETFKDFKDLWQLCVAQSFHISSTTYSVVKLKIQVSGL